ncbi:MAG: hypothetical protein PUB57_08235 [Selenomonadaceae bacterium]|nr:hypothetical protein [Selenomonadaceae bacterium]
MDDLEKERIAQMLDNPAEYLEMRKQSQPNSDNSEIAAFRAGIMAVMDCLSLAGIAYDNLPSDWLYPQRNNPIDDNEIPF